MMPVLFVLFGLILAFFLFPVLIALKLERQAPAAPVTLQVNWGFFAGATGVQLCLQAAEWHLYPLLLGRRLGFPRIRLGPRRAAPALPAPAKPAPKARARRLDLGRLWGLVEELARPGARMLGRLARTFRFRRLHLEGAFGLVDPAATGGIFGCLQGIGPLLPGRLRLDLCPDFTEPGARGRLHLAIHFYLGRALLLAALFAVWLAWRLLVLRRVRAFWGPRTTAHTRR